jgi:hypothetical protein
MSKFFVYSDGKGAYLKITKTLKVRRVYDISRASVWRSKSEALSWKGVVKEKHPQFSLHEAKLYIKPPMYSDGNYYLI